MWLGGRIASSQVLAATSVANVSSLTSIALISKFDQLWGFVEKYRYGRCVSV